MNAVESQTLSLGPDRPDRFASILFTETRRFAFARRDGELRTDLIRVGDGGLRVSRVLSTGHEIELKEAGAVTLLAPLRGRLEIDRGRKTWRAAPGQMLAFRPSTRVTRAIAPGGQRFEGHVVMLPEPRLATLRAAAAGDARARTPDADRIDGPGGLRLAAYLGFLFEALLAPEAPGVGPATAGRLAALLEDLLAEALAGWGAARPPAAAEARRVRMAEEIMRARAAEPLAMHEVAEALGVGLRSLQLAFRAVRGEEPRATLARIRLEGARARLLAATEGDSVTAIALDCGFAHLGRFADAYRRTYGERPGETLARRR